LNFGQIFRSKVDNFEMKLISIGIPAALVSVWQSSCNQGNTMQLDINFETVSLSSAEAERIQFIEAELEHTECHLVMLVLE
jgi:hypothetical protein